MKLEDQSIEQLVKLLQEYYRRTDVIKKIIYEKQKLEKWQTKSKYP